MRGPFQWEFGEIPNWSLGPFAAEGTEAHNWYMIFAIYGVSYFETYRYFSNFLYFCMSGCPSALWFGGSTWWHGARGPVRASLFSHPLLARLVRWAPTLGPAGSRWVPLGSACVLPKYIYVSVVCVYVCAAARVFCMLFAAKLEVVHLWLNPRTV